MADVDDLTAELGRVVDRLNSLPLAKVEPLVARCHEVAALIVDCTRASAPTTPPGSSLPTVGATAAGAQLQVVGRDYLAVAGAGSPDVAVVLAALTDLRRALP